MIHLIKGHTDERPRYDDPYDDEDSLYEDGPQQLYSGLDSWPTSRVCEAVYYDPDLRRRVLDSFAHQPHVSWAPNYLFDTTAVVRHAGRADRWRRYRDAMLSAVYLAFIAAAVAGFLSHDVLPLATTAVVLIAVTPVVPLIIRWRELTLRKVRAWLWRVTKRRPLHVVLALVAMIVVPPGLASIAVQRSRVTDVCLVAGGAALIMVIGSVDAALVMRWALQCRELGSIFGGGIPLLRHRAPLLSAGAEKRLEGLDGGPEPDQTQMDEGVVIVYNIAERSVTNFIGNVFVGSGASLGDDQINVDIAKGRPNSDGTRVTPKPVRMPELHRTLEQVARRAAEPGYWCGYRMYVDDTTLFRNDLSPLNAYLMPDPQAGPRSRLPLNLHQRYLHSPTAHQRTHLCIQVPITRWNGDIVVTLFVRGDLTASVLTVHSDILVLPEVKLPAQPKGYPATDRWTLFTYVLRAGLVGVWWQFMQSPARLICDAWASAARRVHHLGTRSDVKHRRELRHGSVCSIREEMARGGRIVHPNAIDDISQAIAYLMHTLKAGLRTYLEECDIDTAPLDDEVRNVINNQINKIGELHAKNVTFGERSPAGDNNQGTNQNQGQSQSPGQS